MNEYSSSNSARQPLGQSPSFNHGSSSREKDRRSRRSRGSSRNSMHEYGNDTEFDSQMEKMQMEVLLNSYEHLDSKDSGKNHPSTKDFLFSFRNEDLKQSSNRSGQSMQFLQEVNLGSQSSRKMTDRSNTSDPSKKASRESHRSNGNGNLFVIEEDA